MKPETLNKIIIALGIAATIAIVAIAWAVSTLIIS